MKNQVVLVWYFLVMLPLLSQAQGLGSIVGTVTDPSGAAVATAKITATQTGTRFSRQAIASGDGYYIISSLNPASYDLSVEATGFRLEKQVVTVFADQALTVNLKLQMGTASQVLEVTSNALQVDTSTSTLKQVLEQRRIEELPLNGRNAAQLTLLVAGAVNAPNGGADQGATKTFPSAVTLFDQWHPPRYHQLPTRRR